MGGMTYSERPMLSRPPLNPSLLCNLFGCKNGEWVSVSKEDCGSGSVGYGYYECSRCGEREGFIIGTLEIIKKIR